MKVENSGAAAAVKFEDHNVVDGKVQRNKIPGWFTNGLESLKDVEKVQARYNEKVAKEKAANETPTWKLIAFFPYYGVKFALTTLADLFSKLFSICFGPSESGTNSVESK